MTPTIHDLAIANQHGVSLPVPIIIGVIVVIVIVALVMFLRRKS